MRYDQEKEASETGASLLNDIVIPNASHDSISNITWLKMVTNNNCYAPQVEANPDPSDPPPDWTYAKRRQAQALTPFIFLGPANVAKDEEFLKSKGITMVLVVKDPKVLPGALLESRTAERLGIEVQKINFDTDKLVAKFEEAVEVINTHLAHQYVKQQRSNHQLIANRQEPDTSLPARVLVYDLTGTEASATIVGAYLVAMYGCKAWECTFLIHSKRFCVNAQFVQEYMIRWHDLVEARKQIRMAQTQVPGSVPTPPAARQKRAMDVDEELDDFARFGVDTSNGNGDASGRRQILAPFADRDVSEDTNMGL